MGDFNRDNRFSGKSNFGRRDRGGERFQMHKAVCSKCAKECEVPFMPSGDRPVFCSECFEKNGNTSSRRSGGTNFGRSNFNDRPMYSAVCAKCGNSCNVPFQPRTGKPVYCSQCFENKDDRKNGKDPQQNKDQYKEQFTVLNAKLDKILKILVPTVSVQSTPVQTVEEKKIVEEIESPKPKKSGKKTKKAKTKENKEVVSSS